jgi:hypothetical protein
MKHAVGRAVWETLLLGLLWSSCGCAARAPSLPASFKMRWFPRENPIEAAVADALQVGMTLEEVWRTAGEPPVFGASVTPLSDADQPPDAYRVFWDQGQDHDPSQGTSLYPIRSEPGAPDRYSQRYLFVDMENGVVSKVYQGRIGMWVM